ncbi:MAG: low specificity L-threonine aldolase [Pseudobdellovibrionaceae bacterium]
MNRRGFGSDNHSGVHPKLMQALQHANEGHAPSYGTDSWSEKAILQFKKEFGEHTEAFFVFNGTAANVLSLRALVAPYQAVLCSDVSHLQMDECGAPEFFAGCKLLTLPSQQGKISLSTLKETLIRRGDQHYSQAKVLSLTQPTELGTCYSLQEMRDIITWAHQENLWVHVDGSRLANAAHTLGVTFRQLTTDLGVDVVSFGGTKNGLMMGEAVLFLNSKLAENFKYIRKQSAQLPSKTRFLAAQFETYLGSGLWKEIAAHSCQMAERLYQGLQKNPGVQLTAPRESNAVFAKIPRDWVKKLREHFFFYVWDEKNFECRLMTSWDTTQEDIDGFLTLAQKLAGENK